MQEVDFAEIHPSPIETIALHDSNSTIRVVDLPDKIKDEIWSALSPREKEKGKFRRYFLYKLDLPPLRLVIEKAPHHTSEIESMRVKGHGASRAVRIPHILDVDLGYILGAIRDGGIHKDKKAKAFKVHFAQKDRSYLEREIVPRLEGLFGPELKPKIEQRTDGVHQIQFASKPIYLFFSEVCQMKEIQQYWETPHLMITAPKTIKKAYIRGFHDAEGSSDHLYHSWYLENGCEPLQFISDVLNREFHIRATAPMRMKTSGDYDRFPAYQVFINDYDHFKKEILAR